MKKEKIQDTRRFLSDAEVENEIQMLQQSEYVKLARQEERIRYRRREYLYHLRQQEKRGRQLAALGWTPDMDQGAEDDEAQLD